MIPVDAWKPADNLVLEPNALKAAIAQIGSLALTAGPGAGKSEMLAQRADFLLRTETCRYPQRILAISFKVDASANLKERVQRRCGRDLGSRFDSHTFHAFAKRLIDRYRPVLTGDDALDWDYTIGPERALRTTITFNDLVPLAIQIVSDSEIARNSVRLTYSDVFLDEFQDCTSSQYKLIKALFHGTSTRLVAVGDTKQKIMGWAGAMEGIFVDFAKDFRAMPLNLYRNFRSLPQLLRMQNKIIRALDPDAVMPDELISGEGGIIDIQYFDNSEAEANFIADTIQQLVDDEKIPFSEIAVLVSKQPHLYCDLLMEQLEKRGIPFRNEQDLQDLSSEPIARLIVDFLLVVFCDREPDAYTRLVRLLIDASGDDDQESRSRQNWNNYIGDARRRAAKSNNSFEEVWPFAEKFLKEYGPSRIAALSADYESSARLGELIDDTEKRFRESLRVDSDIRQALALLTTDSGVRILTIHKCKGLEFDSVFILGVEKENFWGKPVDERCAFFVGVSRAKRRLFLTHVGQRRTPQPAPNRWDNRRRAHDEFIGYAKPFAVT